MDDSERFIQEATRISLAMLAGDAAPEECARLSSLIANHPQVASAVLEIVGQETWLAWSSKELADSMHGLGLPCLFDEVSEAEKTLVAPAVAGRVAITYPYRYSWLLAAGCLLLLAGALGGAYFTGGLGKQPLSADPLRRFNHLTNFSGRILNPSACRWSPGSLHSMLDGELLQGQSLNILEGIAEVRLQWPTGVAKLAVEGPSGVVLTTEEGCNLSHGRLTADVSTSGAAFRVDAPNCQVIVAQKALLGVLVDGHRVEVHALQGHATVVVPWSAEDLATQHIDLFEGGSLTIDEDSEGNLQVSSGTSHFESFVSCTSMLADKLAIPDAYVRRVQSLAPLLYWRFEGTADELLASSVQPGIAAQAYGKISFQQDAGNQYVEIGGDSSAKDLMTCLVSSEPLDADLRQGYSLEMWFKPRHYQRGVLAGMVPTVQPENQSSGHGMLLELGGPIAVKPALEKAGKVRFLHRSPPSRDISKGTSCFSDDMYALRRWQHIVAVKDSGELRLYLDGNLSSSSQDSTSLTPGLQLVIGKIDKMTRYRQFIGQLDEIAFYARPLSPEEILHHYRLVRPEVEGEVHEVLPSI